MNVLTPGPVRRLVWLLIAWAGVVAACAQIQSSGTTATLRGVTYGKGRFVAVGDGGAILTSLDAITWRPVPSGTTKALYAVTCGPEMFAAVGDDQTVVTSPDGLVWTPWTNWTSNTGARLYAVAWIGDQFRAVGERATQVGTLDGRWVNWGGSVPSETTLRGVLATDSGKWAGEMFLAGSSGIGTQARVNTFDYTPWRPVGADLTAVTRGLEQFVAVGTRGAIWTSRTGETWQQATAPGTSDLLGVTYWMGNYFAVGASGTIWTTRGLSQLWQSADSGTTATLRAVAAGERVLVAVGDSGTILRRARIEQGAPVIEIPPASATIRAGGAAGFRVVAGGQPPLTYQWLRNGQPLAGATTAQWGVSAITATDGGSYTVRVTNEAGSVTSEAVALTINPASATPIVDPGFRADSRLDALDATGATDNRVQTLFPLSDGRILVRMSRAGSVRTVRLLADGRIDAAFNPPAGASILAMQPDGRMLATLSVTSVSLTAPLLIRLLEDGSPDPSFVTPASLAGYTALPKVGQVVCQPDGKILVLADSSRLLFRLLSDGSVDPDFQRSITPNFQVLIGRIALANTGTIYRVMVYNALQRYLPNGQPDPSFRTPLPASTSSPVMGSRDYQIYRGADNRMLIDYETWNGSGGTSVSYITGSTLVLPDDRLGSRGTTGWVTAEPAPDGSFAMSPQSRIEQPLTGFTLWSADARTALPINWGVVPSVSSLDPFKVVMTSRDVVWVGGGFSHYNGVPSPRVVRLNRVVSEVAEAPQLVATWCDVSTARAGVEVTVRVAALSDGPVTYEWALGAGAWPSETNLYGYIRQTIAPNYTFQASGPGPLTWAVRARNSAGASLVARGTLTVTPTPLTLAARPARVSTEAGRDLQLRVTAPLGASIRTAEWRKDGTALSPSYASSYFNQVANEPTSTYTLRNVSRLDAGTYTVTVTSNDGQRATSEPIVVTVGDSSRLANFSVRGYAGPGDQALVLGLTVPDGPSRQVYLRGIGPGLAPFGVTDALPEPVVDVYNARGRLAVLTVAGSRSYTSDYYSYPYGAFRLTQLNRDVAHLTEGFPLSWLQPGGYTLRLSDALDRTGTCLLEVYEADRQSDRLTNFSARAWVPTGSVAVAGFVIQGPVNKRVLIRAAGPALAALGVSGALPNPRLELRSASGALVAANDDWQNQSSAGGATAVSTTSTAVGAFAFTNGSRDAALLVTLPPGNYSAVVAGVGAESGVALVEVYEAP